MVLDDAGLSTGGSYCFLKMQTKSNRFPICLWIYIATMDVSMMNWLIFQWVQIIRDWLCLMLKPAQALKNKGSNNNAVLLGHNPDLIQSISNCNHKFSQLVGSETALYIKSINGKTIANV